MNRIFEIDEFIVLKYHNWFKTKYDICDIDGNKLMYAEDVLWSWTSQYERTLFFEDKRKAKKIFSFGRGGGWHFAILDKNKQSLGKLKPDYGDLSSRRTEPFWFFYDNVGEEVARINCTWNKSDPLGGPLFNFIFKSEDKVLCEIRCHTPYIPDPQFGGRVSQVRKYTGIKAIIKLKRDAGTQIDARVAIASAIFFFMQCACNPVIEKVNKK